nr:MAG TPA_asm: hypothetical protein [Bacteriophage sp.]
MIYLFFIHTLSVFCNIPLNVVISVFKVIKCILKVNLCSYVVSEFFSVNS